MSSTPDPNNYPSGWDRERVQKVVDYYENQTEDEELAEIEEAERGRSWCLVPNEIVQDVLALIEAHEARKAS